VVKNVWIAGVKRRFASRRARAVGLATLVTGVVAAVIGGFAVLPASADTTSTVKVLIHSEGDNNLCIDSKNGGNGTQVILWTCDTDNPNQQWIIPVNGFYGPIRNIADNLCLDPNGLNGGTVGGALIMWPCQGTKNQRWGPFDRGYFPRVPGGSAIQNQNHNPELVVDVPGANYTPGVGLIMYTLHQGNNRDANQGWYYEAV
jgi:ricin-type beta-trefoil lectin protein